jgi:hypothetical protein
MVDAALVSFTEHFCVAYEYVPTEIAFYSNYENARADGSVFVIGDVPPDEGELGHHTEESDGEETGFAFAQPVLKAGGAILTLGTAGCSLASVLDHELKEWRRDPNVNLWRDAPANAGYMQMADETADPVEMISYPVTLPGGTIVWMSDFVLEAYFDPQAPKDAKLTWCDSVKHPFELAEGGYAVVRDGVVGSERQIFHRKVPTPKWKMVMKGHAKARTFRRIG